MRDGPVAVVVNEKDNVSTALVRLTNGRIVCMPRGEVRLLADVPSGHKFALEDIPAGEHIIKCGYSTGRATTAIRQGDHVHVHNVEDIVDETRNRNP